MSESAVARKARLGAERVGVGWPGYWKLCVFADVVARAFGQWPYLVGSSTTSKTFRDVDLRVILADDEFARRFAPSNADHWPWIHEPASVISAAFSALGREMTGLPIDLQIVSLTAANLWIDGPRVHVAWGPLATKIQSASPFAVDPE